MELKPSNFKIPTPNKQKIPVMTRNWKVLEQTQPSQCAKKKLSLPRVALDLTQLKGLVVIATRNKDRNGKNLGLENRYPESRIGDRFLIPGDYSM